MSLVLMYKFEVGEEVKLFLLSDDFSIENRRENTEKLFELL